MLNISLSVSGIVAVVAAIIITILAVMRADQFLQLEQIKTRNLAIDGCAQNSKYIHTEIKGEITDVFEEPNQGLYTSCLQLKGITNDQK